MPAKQHAIPQNIMDVEFKLVGDLTLRQFVYVGVGIAIAYISFMSDVQALIKWTMMLIFGGGGLAFAFVPIDDRSLDSWLINFFKAIYSPTQRIWRKKGAAEGFITEVEELKPLPESIKEKALPKPPLPARFRKREGLERTPLDIKEEDFLKKLKFEITVPIKEEPKLPEQFKKKSPLPALDKRKIESKLKPFASEINYTLSPVFTVYTAEKGPAYASALQNVQPSRRLRLPKEKIATPIGILWEEPKGKVLKEEPEVKVPREKLKPESKEQRTIRNQRLLMDIRNLTEKIKSYGKRKKEVPKIKADKVKPQKPSLLKRLFPKRDATLPEKKKKEEKKPPFLDFIKEKKKLPAPLPPKPATLRPKWEKELPPKEKSEIPVQKTEPLTPKEELKVLEQRINKLRQLTKTKAEKDKKGIPTDIGKTMEYYKKQLRRVEEEKSTLAKEIEKQKTLLQEEKKKKTPPPPPPKVEIKEDVKKQIQSLLEENKKLLTRIEAGETDLEKYKEKQRELVTKSDVYNRQLAEHESLVKTLKAEKENLNKQIEELQKKTTGKVSKAEQDAEMKTRVVTKEEEPKRQVTPVIIQDKPNIINGVVKGTGGALVNDAIVIVRDTRGNPVRALKTNDLGQFTISTPLPNGKYQIAVEKPGEKFDIIEAEISGTILKPIIFQGK